MISLKDRIQLLEKVESIKVLTEFNWIMVRAAKQLGITETMGRCKLRKYQIRKDEMKSEN